jgi:hypothetical protein
MNALKDGCYAETAVLPGESKEEYDRHVQLWHTRLGVIDGPEEFFSAAGAAAAWKHQRCLRASESAEQRRKTEARRRQTPDPEQELRKAARIAESLHKQPLDTVIHLCESPAGCEWLKNQWMILYNDTKDDDCLFNHQRIRGCWLLRKRPRELFDDPSVWEFTRIFLGSLLSIRPELKSEIINVFLKEVPTEEHGYYGSEFEYRFNHMLRCKLPKTAAEAAALQRDFISKEMAKLEARAAWLGKQRAEDAGFDAAEAPLETTVEGARRERQIASLFRRAERGVANARMLRDARRREEQSDDSSRESSGDKGSAGDDGASPEGAMTPEPLRAETPTPAAGGQSPAGTPEPPTDRLAQEAPAAVAGASGSAGTAVPENRNGLGGGIVPALVLLLLLPLLGGPGRETAPQPRGSRSIALAAGTSAVGLTVAPARRVGRDSVDRFEAHRTGRGTRWASSRHVGIRPALPRWRRGAAFDRPYRPRIVCRNDPKLGASRAASRESSFGIEHAVATGLRPRDSPGLRGPPP